MHVTLGAGMAVSDGTGHHSMRLFQEVLVAHYVTLFLLAM